MQKQCLVRIQILGLRQKTIPHWYLHPRTLLHLSLLLAVKKPQDNCIVWIPYPSLIHSLRFQTSILWGCFTLGTLSALDFCSFLSSVSGSWTLGYYGGVLEGRTTSVTYHEGQRSISCPGSLTVTSTYPSSPQAVDHSAISTSPGSPSTLFLLNFSSFFPFPLSLIPFSYGYHFLFLISPGPPILSSLWGCVGMPYPRLADITFPCLIPTSYSSYSACISILIHYFLSWLVCCPPLHTTHSDLPLTSHTSSSRCSWRCLCMHGLCYLHHYTSCWGHVRCRSNTWNCHCRVFRCQSGLERKMGQEWIAFLASGW